MIKSGDIIQIFFEDGKHLAEVSDEAGGNIGALLDDVTNRVAGQARLYPVDATEDVLEKIADGFDFPTGLVVGIAAGVAIGVVGTIVGMKNAPRIKMWWGETPLANLKSKLMAAPHEQSSAESSQSPVVAVLSNSGPKEFSKAVDLAFEEHRQSMSSEEAQQRLLAILVAAAFIADQMRRLADADIDLGEDRAVLEKAMSRLTPAQVTEGFNMMLSANAALLDDDTAHEFVKIFGGGQVVNGEYVPVSNDRVREALRLTDGDDDAAPALV